MRSQANDLSVAIRQALVADAPRIAALAVQLGYEVPLQHVERYLQGLNERETVLVAVVPRAGVVGWIGIAQHETLTVSNCAEIQGLVVADEYRSNGIGELLVHAAEAWSAQRGCAALRLHTNVVRERAHEFYHRIGYERLKSQHVFQKNL